MKCAGPKGLKNLLIRLYDPLKSFARFITTQILSALTHSGGDRAVKKVKLWLHNSEYDEITLIVILILRHLLQHK